jgi:hypothetical protein
MTLSLDIICCIGGLVGASALFLLVGVTSPRNTVFMAYPFFLRALAFLNGASMLWRAIDFYDLAMLPADAVRPGHADFVSVPGWTMSCLFLCALAFHTYRQAFPNGRRTAMATS